MIFGECPYCGSPTHTPIADKCPAFSKEKCTTCQEFYWLYHSRAIPEAMTEKEFHEKWEVDDEKRTIKAKVKP